MGPPPARLSLPRMAAVFDLNHHAHYVNFHIGGGNPPFFSFSMSLSNVIVIVVMLVVFALAIALPFPHYAGAGKQQ
jgi:hypothetical protein